MATTTSAPALALSAPRFRRDHVLLPPPNVSDISEAGSPTSQLTKGEVLQTDLTDSQGCWEDRTDSYSSYPYSSQLRNARARCSSSTLFDEAQLQSGKLTIKASAEQLANTAHHSQPSLQQQHQHQQKLGYRQAHEQAKKQTIMFVDKKPESNHRSVASQGYNYGYSSQVVKPDPSKPTTCSAETSSLGTNSCAESPSYWNTASARLKMEPSTPIRSIPHHALHNSESSSSNLHKAASSSTKSVSPPPLSTPSTSITPTPAELDKPTKNLMIFNKIPRQWPASQETLHHNYMAKSIKKPTVLKEFDSATAERIDRVINKERTLSRAAKERLAAEQKEAELEARGFFDPARRWKGRDVYPRPANWIYCRRTKNNWLEKTKVLADTYKLFKAQVLGKGHHADVYKGIDLATGQDLAIKVIYKTVTRRLGFVNEDPMQEVKNRRLLNEAWFIDYLKDGPGICKMIRVVETSTKFYFVMELAHSDLNSYSNGINMREEEIRHIMKPIFECLKYAHARDITHRDIKPENILLKTRNDWLRANTNGSGGSNSGSSAGDSNSKLGKSSDPSKTTKHSRNDKSSGSRSHKPKSLHRLDDSSSTQTSTFANESYCHDGLTDTNDERSSMDSSTFFNYYHRFDAFLADWGLAVEHDCNSGRKPVGTPLYAAPEVVRKMKRIRRREWINYRACDIWSLGVTMFVVASGIYPYHTHDALEAQAPPNWAALEASGMSREYIAFTQRLMNLTAELRPSATEACTDAWLQM